MAIKICAPLTWFRPIVAIVASTSLFSINSTCWSSNRPDYQGICCVDDIHPLPLLDYQKGGASLLDVGRFLPSKLYHISTATFKMWFSSFSRMPALNLNRTAFYGDIHRVGRRFFSRMPATNLNRTVFYGEVHGVDNMLCIQSVHIFLQL